jgi:L-aspartate oxidase
VSEQRDVDVVVVGGGAAGLSAALAAARTRSVALLVKGALGDGATGWAQGGIAAAVGADDSVASHLVDTMAAGAALCDPASAADLVGAAPRVVARLRRLGARFDVQPDGSLALGREGGHRRHRIVHAGGDRTGAEVSRTLVGAVRERPVEVVEHATVTDLLLDEAGQAAGVVYRDPTGNPVVLTAHAVVLATGGLGQLYQATSNPPESTGDGLALALRAGAVVADAEFVQVHPTVLWTGPGGTGQQPLVTEALRGAGAVLLDPAGRRLMPGRHPLADLAPRDVVAAALHETITAAGAAHGYLDATGVGRDRLEREFPTVVAAARRAGADPVSTPIPVAPGAHYHCGGVRADAAGRTDVAGLLAVGEVARTGLHGANRLASNSLLEAVATGTRAGRMLATRLPDPVGAPTPTPPAPVVGDEARSQVRELMTAAAGVSRDGESLASLVEQLDKLADTTRSEGTQAAGTAHLRLAAATVAHAALARRESRGCHQRTDFADPDPRWQRPVLIRLHAGELHSWLDEEEQSA